MLDNIISLVKDQVLNVVSQNADIPADKKNSAVETTTSTIVDGLKDQLSSGGISSITNLFGGTDGGGSILSTLGNLVESALVDKVGLSKDIASSIASTAVPAVVNFISSKSQDANDSFNVESLLGALGGDGKKESGLLSKLGSLFGK